LSRFLLSVLRANKGIGCRWIFVQSMRTGKPCSNQSLGVRENIGWHRSPFYCVAVVLRSTFQRSRGIIEKGWHLFLWNAVNSLVPQSSVCSRKLYRSLTFTLLATLVTLMREASSTPGVCGLRSSVRPSRRYDRSTLELRENVAILWRSLLSLLIVHFVHSTYRSLRSLHGVRYAHDLRSPRGPQLLTQLYNQKFFL
jgi:hypothetical protein